MGKEGSHPFLVPLVQAFPNARRSQPHFRAAVAQPSDDSQIRRCPHYRARVDSDAHARLRRARLAFGHGTTNAWDEAVYLVLHALRLPLDELTPVLARKVTIAETKRALRLLDERIQRRIPAAYLTREAWLGDLRFYVDERVIVPR